MSNTATDQRITARYVIFLAIRHPIQFILSILEAIPEAFKMVRDYREEAREQKMMKDWSSEQKKEFYEAKYQRWLSKQDQAYQDLMK